MTVKTNKHTLLLLVGAVLLSAGVGLLAGKFWLWPKPDAVTIDTHVLDSLAYQRDQALDSIEVLKLRLYKASQNQVKYRSKYDTIVVEDEAREVLHNLRGIINTPVDR